MDSRERTTRTLNHQEQDLVPLELGGSAVTGMHVSSVCQLRQADYLFQTLLHRAFRGEQV